MKLSIIIVSYNVSAFLENCLKSVFRALDQMEHEVWVVDNHSVDNTVFMLRERFPDVKLIENHENVGFAVANNQAIRKATGEYVLLLNPDTIVSEDCFARCTGFMEEHPDCGALGVKMYDGSGAYLPESKRGFPTPFASFTKMTGLYRLFPKSGFWNQYYLGHLDEDETHEIDVLTGAFFFMRRSALNKVGGLDEDFFMYGEDIDLSFRIKEAGYRIFYLPTTSIIHFKGESTKKGSLDYVKTFYQAMIIFARKHFKGTRNRLMVRLLKIAIYFAGISSFLSGRIKGMIPMALDILLMAISILGVTYFWAVYYYQNPGHFDRNFYMINMPVYILTLAIALRLRGAYHRFVQWKPFFLGLFFGGVAILILYALFPLSLRSSRIVILLFLGSFLVAGSAFRLIYERLTENRAGNRKNRRVLFVGQVEEYNRIRELINRTNQNIQVVGALSVHEKYDHHIFLNHVSELQEVCQIYAIDEVIFSSDALDFSEITMWMTRLGADRDYKIASRQSWQIIGSASKDISGEFYGVDIAFKLNDPFVKRNKRLVDLFLAVLLSLISPVLLFSWKRPLQFYRNVFSIFKGKFSWVGYAMEDRYLSELPNLKPGVLQISVERQNAPGASSYIHNVNYLYARDYRVMFDVEHVFKHLSFLDQTITR